MDDDYHIRLWKTSVEIDAVPKVILHRILMEQHLWDPNLQQTNILEILDDETDIYQYTAANMSPLPSREYVVLRLETLINSHFFDIYQSMIFTVLFVIHILRGKKS